MLKKLEDHDHRSILSFLELDEPMNMPMIGDFNRHGLHSGFQDMWIQVNEAGEWHTLIRRYFEHYTVFSPKKFWNDTMHQSMFIDNESSRFNNQHKMKKALEDLEDEIEELGWFIRLSNPVTLSGCYDFVKKYAGFLPDMKEIESQQMLLFSDIQLIPTEVILAKESEGLIIAVAEENDTDEIGNLMFATEAFRHNYESPEEISKGIRTRLKKGGVRHFILKKGDEIVAHANTTAETERFALISGVTTKEVHQRKGYSGMLVSALSAQLLAQGKQPCLYCKSPEAAFLYRKLGFIETEKYGTLTRL